MLLPPAQVTRTGCPTFIQHWEQLVDVGHIEHRTSRYIPSGYHVDVLGDTEIGEDSATLGQKTEAKRNPVRYADVIDAVTIE